MERELFEHIVMSVCKSSNKTKQIMDIVYSTPLTNYIRYIKCYCGKIYAPSFTCCPYCEPPVVVSPTQSNKKQELIDSLDYLKKKEYKTDKDKESISIIQAILNGMK
jgi:hypothetical protein